MRESLKLELFRTPWHRLHISDSPISYLKKLMNLCFRHVIFTLLGSHDLYLFMNVYIQRRTNWTSSKLATLWANWFHRCYDNMIIQFVKIRQWSETIGKSNNIFHWVAVVKNKTETLPTLLTASHSSYINAYSTFYKFLKNWQKKSTKVSRMPSSHHAVHHAS